MMKQCTCELPICLPQNNQQGLDFIRLRLMLLFAGLLILLGSSFPAFSQGPANKKVSLEFKNTKLADVLTAIEKQTSLLFYYNAQKVDVDRKVNISVKNVPVETALNQLFKSKSVDYKFVKDHIVLTAKGEVSTFKEPDTNNKPAAPSTRIAKVSGQVTDSQTGAPLSGASVSVSGVNKGIQTDADGKFEIEIPKDNKAHTLNISYVGYTAQTLPVNATNITVPLVLNAIQSAGDEVVVIGYGTTTRKQLTGAVTSISGKELEKIPVANVAEALTGRMPGVQVTTVDGQPGAEIVIRVRGGGSVTQDNSPLYIVDGFPVGSINDIAPTDIETIDVLKDASSSAIYGARGANGVVIITTKNAKAGKTNISYNGFMQYRAFPRQLEVLSPYEFVLANYEYARLRSQADVDNFTKYFGVYEDLELYKAQEGTNWQDELFGNPAASQQHNINVSGGTAKTKMSLGFSKNNDEGLMIGSSYKRNYLNFKLNHEISSKLKLDFATRYSAATTMGAGTAGGSSVRVSDALTTRPVNGLADQFLLNEVSDDQADDYDQFLKSRVNPTDIAAQDYRRRLVNTLNLNGGISWTIIKGLIFRTELSIDRSSEEIRRYYGPLTGESRNVGGNLPLGEITDFVRNGIRQANTLTYNFKLKDDHQFTVMAGNEWLDGDGSRKFMRAKYFAANLSPDKLFTNMALGTMDRMNTDDKVANSLLSYFGRVNYTFNKKYIFTFTVRADGSSLFAPQNRWGYFPSASGAWRISDEAFMEDLKFVSDMKLRVSYGQAGNNRIGADQWRTLYGISDNRTIGFGGVANPYYVFASSLLTNPDLKWETTVTRNAGLDFSMFKNKLTASLDFYWNTTRDLLIESDIPPYLGFSKQMRNIGSTSNRGFELGLNAFLVDKKDFSLNANFNIGINRSRIDRLDGVNEKQFNSNWASTDLKSQDDYRIVLGRTVGLMYGFVTDGWYKEDDFESYDAATRTYKLKDNVPAVGALMGGLSVRPGLLKLKDLNGDGLITSDKDRQIIGNAMPKFSGGFGVNSAYKGIDLSLFFNYVYGNDVYNTSKIAQNMFYRTTYGNMLNTMNSDNRYKYIDPAGNQVTDLEALRALNTNATIWTPFSMGNASPVFHSYAVEDGSFLRLNNVTLGYSLPANLIKKVKMQRFRIYATIYNAFLWTKYSGYDPEVSATRNSGYSALTPGVDFSGYPKSRTYTAGINVTF